MFEKDYLWNPATCSCENGKYLANIMYDYVWWNYRGKCQIIWRRNKNYYEKYNLWNKEFLYFTCVFINYNFIIDSCYYLLLSDKI